MAVEGLSVPIEAAARWVDVEVGTIRDWSYVGALRIERRDGKEVVRLDRVRALADRRGSLRKRLSSSEIVASRGAHDLQRLVRDRDGTAESHAAS